MRPHCLLIGTKGEGTVARSPKGVVSPTAVGHQLGRRAWTHDRGQSLPSATGSVTMPRPKPRDQNGRGWGGASAPRAQHAQSRCAKAARSRAAGGPGTGLVPSLIRATSHALCRLTPISRGHASGQSTRHISGTETVFFPTPFRSPARSGRSETGRG